MPFVIRFDDGMYNYGPEATEENGFPVRFVEATRYTTVEAAEKKLVNLLYPDGSGAEIIVVEG